MPIEITIPGVDAPVHCLELDGEERLGEGFAFEAVIHTTTPIAAANVLRHPVRVRFGNASGERSIVAVVTRWTAIARIVDQPVYHYRAILRPQLALLELRRRSRAYRNQTVPAIVTRLLTEGGYPAAAIASEVGAHAEREYVVQYEETDAQFLRRMCEDEGIFLRFMVEGDPARVAIADDSTQAPAALPDPVPLVDEGHFVADVPQVFHPRVRRRRRAGTVLLRDYDAEHPALNLEGTAADGSAVEREAAYYAAPGGFFDENGGRDRARLALESARADARVVRFSSTAFALAPGLHFELDSQFTGAGVPTGAHLVVAIRHRYRLEDPRHVIEVETIPKAVPFRLARVSPRPRIAGVQSVVTTGDGDEEIETDALGRVFVRFHWDVESPTDKSSSLPIRTMQPNTPDSLLLPRVGWEVFAAFEDGDPDRPYVLGRSYNSGEPPPFALPANKTVTSFATDSSPGAGGRQAIMINDAAGAEHMSVQAPFNLNLSVGDKMVRQTGANERYSVDAAHVLNVGAAQTLSVTQAFLASLGSWTCNVGAFQMIGVTGDLAAQTGTEITAVGAALVEQAGNPVTGAINLVQNAALNLVGRIPMVGPFLAAGLGTAKAAYEGYRAGGTEGAWAAAGRAGEGILYGLFPGGEAALAYQRGQTQPNPWDHGRPVAGETAPGGGAGSGASDSAGAAGAGPGHRIINCSGFAGETTGSFRIMTPGQIGWTTMGVAALSSPAKSINARWGTFRTLGVSIDRLGTRELKSTAKVSRKSLVSSTVSCSTLSMKTPVYAFQARSLTVDIGGTLSMNGGDTTFVCGDSKIHCTGSNVEIEAKRITISGTYDQGGDMAHS
jgi:type VI secretion system secreted protein VgrG